jgi:U3 small nucleolar ribonucleoprotein protein IMP4
MPKRKKILLTTSRRPTSRIRSFCHDLADCLPDIVRINRGKLNLDGIIEKAFEINADRVVIVDRWKGGPGKIQLFLVRETGLTPVPPMIYIRGIKLRREFEIKTKPVQSFAITTSSESSSRGKKIAEFLAHFFNIPMLPVKQAVSRYSASMHVSTNTSNRTIITFVLLPEFMEVGPRISIAKLTYFYKV